LQQTNLHHGGKNSQQGKSKMTQCNAAHLKTDDSQEEAPVTMINL